MKSILFLLITVVFVMPIRGQKDNNNELADYSKLTELFYELLEKEDDESAGKIARFYLSKAKKENFNTIDHINGHFLMYKTSDFEDGILHLDSLLNISKKLKKNKGFTARAYFHKGGLYHDRKDFANALDNYLEGLVYAEKDGNAYLTTIIKNNIGIIKLERVGEERDALELFKQCEKFYDTITDIKEYSYDYLALIFSLSQNYRKLNLVDSSSYYNKIGIEKSLKYLEKDFEQYFYFSEGVNEFTKGNSENALKLFLESEPVLNKLNDHTNLVELNYYLGSVYNKLGDSKNSLVHFLKMDSLNDISVDYSPQTRKGIEAIINHYVKEDDLSEQLKYVKKLMMLDSVYIYDYKEIVHTINSKYSNDSLIKERESLIRRLDITKNKATKKSYILIAISILLLSMLLYYYFKNKKLRSKFDVLMKDDGNEIPNTNSRISNTHDSNTSFDSANKGVELSDKIVNSILSSLDEFEYNKGYLQSNLNTQQLATTFGTNTKYLSKVINDKKGKSVVAYVNDLRIEHSIKLLKTDKKFRLYTINSIAKEVGFSNPTSFSQSFYKRTGLKPSFFIKRLIRTTNSENLQH